MGAAAILTVYPAVLVAAALALGTSSVSGVEVMALLFAGLLASAGLFGVISMSRQAREPGDP